MATLYLDRRHAHLRFHNRRLEIATGDGHVERIPTGMLERIVISAGVETDSRTLAGLAAVGVTVHLLHGRRSPVLATVLGIPGNDARRRLAQYAAWCDIEHRQALARELLRLKLGAQYRWLVRLRKTRPDKRRVLSAALATLREQRRHLDDPTMNVESMRGIEGAAAAAGFRALAEVLPSSLGFTGRRRRPPPDPVNAVLSLGYTLAYGLAVEAAFAAGLDPAIGYLHEPLQGRQSLAADLMEPLRPRIDALTWRLFRDRRLVADHFLIQDGGCRLNKAGRKVFYTEWELTAGVWRRWLRRLTRALIERLENAGNV